MEHIDEIAEMMADEGGGATAYTAKSVITDAADNHGLSTMALRRMQFWYQGSQLLLTAADFTSGQTSSATANFIAQYAFDTDGSLTGAVSQAAWIALAGNATNQRIWVKFNTPQTFDRIDVVNYHDSGTNTTAGINNNVINITEDTVDPSNAFNDPVTGGLIIYNGVFREHIPSDVADPETLILIP